MKHYLVEPQLLLLLLFLLFPVFIWLVTTGCPITIADFFSATMISRTFNLTHPVTTLSLTSAHNNNWIVPFSYWTNLGKKERLSAITAQFAVCSAVCVQFLVCVCARFALHIVPPCRAQCAKATNVLCREAPNTGH